MGGSNLAGVQQDFDPLSLMNDIQCVPLTPPKHDCPSKMIFLGIRRRGTSLEHNPPAIWPRRWKRRRRWSRPRRGHRLRLGSEVVKGMKPTFLVVSPADDKDSDENESGGPKKRGRPSATRVPGGAESSKKTRRSPATRTQHTINRISKAAGHGAERLGSTTAGGVYHRSMPGLRVPHGSVGTLEQEPPSWIVGREVMETQRDMGSSGPQQIVLPENAEDEEDLKEIPGNLSERERLMLQMTHAEEERGAVRVIKCKLCPKARLSSWVIFERHCRSCEKHPSELRFCANCGDHFARSDSEKRHQEKKDQEACHKTSQDEAKKKRENIERIFYAFDPALTFCLKNGLEIGPRFSEVVAKTLENSSKKVSKTEEILWEGDSWATGLL
jgi:hypothetical protein